MAEFRRDRISNLPRELLKHILSLLPTKEVAQTAVLSRMWGETHSLLPSSIEVDFDEENVQIFDSFIHRVLRRFGQPDDLEKLALTCMTYDDANAQRITQILEVGVNERRLKCLHVHVVYSEEHGYFTLPEVLYTNQYLQELSLSSVMVQPPLEVVFPALRKLLVDISVPSCPSLQAFYNRCPVLENLTLIGHVDDDVVNEDAKRRFEIASHSLQKMKISLTALNDMGGHENKGPNGDYELYTIQIDTPNLKVLYINENVLASYTVNNLASITEAYIQAGWEDVDYEIPAAQNINNIYTLLAGLIHVRRLTLNDRTLANDRAALPNFSQLSHMTLHISHRYGWSILPYLLDRTPSLEVLEIEMVVSNNVAEGDRFVWHPPNPMSACFTQTITQVQLRGFEGNDQLAPVQEYFQQVSHAVREFEIIIS